MDLCPILSVFYHFRPATPCVCVPAVATAWHTVAMMTGHRSYCWASRVPLFLGIKSPITGHHESRAPPCQPAAGKPVCRHLGTEPCPLEPKLSVPAVPAAPRSARRLSQLRPADDAHHSDIAGLPAPLE